MQRQILDACFPWFLMAVAAVGLLLLLARLSGCRLQLARLRRLHACEAGSVQSLGFVLTLPVFIMTVMFVVQVTQLMIGITVVHYAAFACARAACVWIPATVGTYQSSEGANQFVSAPTYNGTTWTIAAAAGNALSPDFKFRKIRSAAVMACAPISPSGALYFDKGTATIAMTEATLYRVLAPTSSTNPKIASRITNKLAYSNQNTNVSISGVDRDSDSGPASYNPRGSPNPAVVWNPNEVGWEDPITVTITHNFALLPGPGRWLIQPLGGAGGAQDTVSGKIQMLVGDTGDRIYTIPLTAVATMSNEGIKSRFPYLQQVD